jgi:hypothetical protein
VTHSRLRTVAIAASAITALATVLLPWYELDAYEPNGWDATWWARGAAGAALATIIALRLNRYRLAAVVAALSAACIAYRTAQPPDFGFAFDGLTVPVERLAGCWVALGSALLALLASARLAWSRPPEPEASPPQGSQSAVAAP